MERRTIGKLADEAGVGVETVRFYERSGLVQQPQKLSGFREYPADTVERIRFIKRAQQLGFSLTEIRELIGLNGCHNGSRAEVKQLTGKKLQEIRQKIEDLERLESTLRELFDRCNGRGSLSGCPIIESIVQR